MKAMRWVLWIAGGIAAVLALVTLAGAMMPRTFVATRTATYAKSPAEVWAVITDFAATPTWRPGVKKAERGPDLGGKPVWNETFRNDMRLSLVTEEAVRPTRLVRRIFGEGLPFTGRWIFVLSPAAGGTRIVLTEEGDVPNPFFRFVSQVVMGHDRHLDTYLKDLGKHFGAEVQPSAP